MSIEERALELLEFDKLRAMLAERALFAGGRERAEAVAPRAVLADVRDALAETGEARHLLDRDGEPPMRGVRDIRPVLGRAARGGLIEPAELLDLAETLTTARRLRPFLTERAEWLPRLAAVARGIGEFRELEDELRRSITPEGGVADTASQELAAVRRRARDLNGRVRDQLETMARSLTLRPYLQEPIVTQRQDRFVLPVKQEFRGRVPGIIHDQSQSGATLFIEPTAIVALNNELKRLALDARREEERVLAGLAAAVARQGGALAEAAEALARLDFAFAKGRLSRDMGAAEPRMNDDGIMELWQARHPLLGSRAVPVDISLGRDFDTLVITGPNTGGKTVTLKTIGLLVLMAQAGLHVPAAPESHLAVFRQVYADIGDEQSIEQNLSTFSSHMRNIVAIAAGTGPGTLVLLDELGAGTDPAEGAAIGRALLEHLQASGARTAATTHLSELKTFAWARERVENASVEFDVDTLAPTYRVAIGVPGRSNAFEIAARLGLKPEVVRRAREFAGRRHEEMEGLLAAVERERRALESERQEAARLRGEAAALADRLERAEASLRQKREEILSTARGQAQAILGEARREAAEAVARLRRAERERGAMALREAEAARHDLHQAGRHLEPVPLEPPATVDGGALTVGRAVYVRSLGLRGRLLEVSADEGRAVVQAGALRAVVPAADLAPILEADAPGPVVEGRGRFQPIAREKAEQVATEIHLRRLTVEEALACLDKYLDDAVLAGLEQVRVVHGKGTGTLRRAVQEYLRTHPLVQGYRLGGPGEGDGGVTIAHLKSRI